MTTNGLILLDLGLSVLAAAGWIGAGATVTRRRPIALGLSGLAMAATLARVVTVLLLARAGWWFVQEKVTLTLPLLVVGAAAALWWLRRPAGPGAVLALLTAGYAAVAGLGLTVLGGYPAGWSSGLLTLAVVVAAATITARALSRPRLRAPAVAAFTLALLAGGLAVVPAPSSPSTPGTTIPGTILASSLRGPTEPAAGGELRRFTLTAQRADVTLASGRTVPAWTFNGQVPGPALTATVGDLIEVTLHNTDITDGVTLHWHGYDVPAGEDGVPGLTQEAVRPGAEFVYRFRADQAGTYWYHTHEVSAVGVRLGLYGTLVVAPAGRAPTHGVDLMLPVHTLDGTVLLADQDQLITQRIAPGTAVRLRLINTDNTPRVFGVGGTAFRVVAVDGDDLHEPGELRQVGLRLAAGGRYDVAFTMPSDPVTLRVAGAPAAGLILAPPDVAVPDGADPGAWPLLDLLRYGTPQGPAPTHFDRDFTLVLDRGLALVEGRPAYAHTVNGLAYPAIPTEQVALGDEVRFTIVNRSPEVHPWHLHGHHVRVLSRDGQAPTGSPLWLDTFDVRPGEVWQVAFTADNPGVWMNHCHNLPHAEQGMAVHLAYQGFAADHGGHG